MWYWPRTTEPEPEELLPLFDEPPVLPHAATTVPAAASPARRKN
jgi:hypothetical protein